jgi:1-acyl-sn-glycerol-3-phosphate acyltransferase
VNPWYWFGYHSSRLLAQIFLRFRILHRERMIQSGPLLLAMNHQSYLDPPLAGNACDRPIYYLTRSTLLNVPVFGRILPKLNVIPVDQEGIDRRALKKLIEVVRAGNGALVFPEGSRTLDGNLQPGQPGIGLIIAKTRAPVVPMRIFGAFEALPRGGGRFRFSRVTVVVGHPIFFTDADFEGGGKEAYGQLSQRVMDAIAAIQLE